MRGQLRHCKNVIIYFSLQTVFFLFLLWIWQRSSSISTDQSIAIKKGRNLMAMYNFNHGMVHLREPSLIDKALDRLARIARARLVNGIRLNINDNNPFDDIIVSLPFTPPIISHGYGDKAVLNPTIYSMPGNKNSCLVYGIGLYNETRFEILMAQYCEVHAFDCTTSENDPAVLNQPFAFHQICIGTPTLITEGTTQNILHNPHPGQPLIFKSYSDIMKDLNHTKVDLLKFDIEGSEWELLEHILQHNAPENAPRQLVFELHTQGAVPAWVPPQTIVGKNRIAVNNIFLRLHDFGYRVLHKQVNPGDRFCADFTLLLSR